MLLKEYIGMTGRFPLWLAVMLGLTSISSSFATIGPFAVVTPYPQGWHFDIH